MNRLFRWSTGFTMLNFLFGFISIAHSVDGEFQAAAWFIILAAIGDALDGKMARLTGTADRLGVELDSMADMVSFGIAPALLVYQAQLRFVSFFGFVFAFAYLFAGGWRLARFNAEQAGDRSNGYYGLTITISGVTVASFVLFQLHLLDLPAGIWMVLMAGLAFLMVSQVNYHWPKVSFRNKRSTISSIFLLSVVPILAVFPRESLFPILLVYIVIPIWRTTCSALALGKS
jgi:CDP-diacylglycerol---serine O-phosphatidyltransferase